jgi:hypothetical protein
VKTKRLVSERVIQLVWFIAGIYGTGALWFYLSRDEYGSAALSTVAAIVLAGVAVYLHGLNDRSKRTREIREALGQYLKEAEKLTARANESPLPIAEHNAWVSAVESYLAAHLDSSYSARFSNFHGMTLYASSNPNSGFKTSLDGRSRRLHEFLTELAQ